jgi:integrase
MNLYPAINSDWTVDSAVRRCVERTAYSYADLLRACIGLATHLVAGSSGVELNDERVFSPLAIEDYVSSLTHMKDASRSNLRSMLYRMSEVLLGVTAKRNRGFALPSSDPSEPYSDGDLVRLERWYSAQTARTPDAAALLALGLGAGLSASEIGNVASSDIEFDSSKRSPRVYVFVSGERQRQVRIDEQWEPLIALALESRRDEVYLFRPKRKGAGKNLISNFIARGPDVGLRPNTQRMRATYLVKHIEGGDSVSELIRIAGVQSLDALARYVRFVS